MINRLYFISIFIDFISLSKSLFYISCICFYFI